MKKFLLITVILASIVSVFAFSENETSNENEGIQFFKGTWAQAIEAAKKENKPIFLNIHASWCSPCKSLKKKTFTNKDVAEFYNKNFINISLDGEEGEGIELSEKYQVRGYPTLLYLKSDGSVIFHTAGFAKASKFKDLGEKILKSQKK